jgi:hypothetical protein
MKKLNQQQKINKWVESDDKSGIYINEEDPFVSFSHNLENLENIKTKLIKTLGNNISKKQEQLIEKL